MSQIVNNLNNVLQCKFEMLIKLILIVLTFLIYIYIYKYTQGLDNETETHGLDQNNLLV